MAKKPQSVFVCQSCGSQSPRWQGKCNECGEWNSFVEERVQATKIDSPQKFTVETAKAAPLFEQLEKLPSLQERIPSGSKEMDRVLGGGFVKGSLLLFGGEPGIGKSTLLLQTLSHISQSGRKVFYLSAEESGAQVAGRAKRLGLKESASLNFLGTTDLDLAIESIVSYEPEVVVVDSVQTLSSNHIESAAGTLSQIRDVTQKFMVMAKNRGIIVLLVGHVTKEGTLAGPRLLEHMVDGVFYFELATASGYRMLRGQKNRFGATHEVAVFEMASKGLLEVDNPSARFLAERAAGMPGSAIIAHLEGSRPFLTEFQALSSRCYQGYPRRTVQGVDQNRISVLLAVAEKIMGQNFSDQDIYCKVASGNRIEEPASDLAMLMALISSKDGKAIPSDLILIGEVGLGGELRSVPSIASRLSEAKSVGVKRAVVPAWHLKEAKEIRGIEIIPARNVRDALQSIWVNKKSENLDLSH